jgi:hypothetical protein
MSVRPIRILGLSCYYHDSAAALVEDGRNVAVAQIGKWKLSSWPAWAAGLFVHLIFLVSFRRKLSVLIQWTYSYFTYKRGARVITGTGGTPPAGASSAMPWTPGRQGAAGWARSFMTRRLSMGFADVWPEIRLGTA